MTTRTSSLYRTRPITLHSGKLSRQTTTKRVCEQRIFTCKSYDVMTCRSSERLSCCEAAATDLVTYLSKRRRSSRWRVRMPHWNVATWLSPASSTTTSWWKSRLRYWRLRRSFHSSARYAIQYNSGQFSAQPTTKTERLGITVLINYPSDGLLIVTLSLNLGRLVIIFQKQYKVETWLQWKTNRKSHVACWVEP